MRAAGPAAQQAAAAAVAAVVAPRSGASGPHPCPRSAHHRHCSQRVARAAAVCNSRIGCSAAWPGRGGFKLAHQLMPRTRSRSCWGTGDTAPGGAASLGRRQRQAAAHSSPAETHKARHDAPQQPDQRQTCCIPCALWQQHAPAATLPPAPPAAAAASRYRLQGRMGLAGTRGVVAPATKGQHGACAGQPGHGLPTLLPATAHEPSLQPASFRDNQLCGQRCQGPAWRWRHMQDAAFACAVCHPWSLCCLIQTTLGQCGTGNMAAMQRNEPPGCPAELPSRPPRRGGLSSVGRGGLHAPRALIRYEQLRPR